MSTFTFSPDYGASKESTPVVRRARFGDGYVQRAQWGINALNETWSLTFANRDADEADEIEDFLSTHNVETFDWTPPGASEAQRFVVESWTRSVPHPGLYTLTATFLRSYDP